MLEVMEKSISRTLKDYGLSVIRPAVELIQILCANYNNGARRSRYPTDYT
jgi:hypothetical protein